MTPNIGAVKLETYIMGYTPGDLQSLYGKHRMQL